MIDEEMTVRMFGYTSDMLAWQSHKKIVVMCDECGKYRIVGNRHSDRDLCLQCIRKLHPSHCKAHSKETKNKISKKLTGNILSEETKQKLSIAHKGLHAGNKHPMFGKRPSKETIIKMSESMIGKNSKENHPMWGKHLSEKTKDKLYIINKGKNHPQFGKKHSEETRRKHSATQQGIPYDEWESFATEQLYCPKFNESCRESNREKYGRRCFVCGKLESENITSTGKQKKLSVHHVDMDKEQGCNGIRWKLVPLCLKHHGIAHNDLWTARIVWLLGNVW